MSLRSSFLGAGLVETWAGIRANSPYPGRSFDLAFFLRFGVGILHSIEKATQLVQGTPRLAASQRTWIRARSAVGGQRRDSDGIDSLFEHGRSMKRQDIFISHRVNKKKRKKE